jgi:hypothetical protein
MTWLGPLLMIAGGIGIGWFYGWAAGYELGHQRGIKRGREEAILGTLRERGIDLARRQGRV